MMKSKKMVYLPAFAAVLVSVLLIAYSFYAASNGVGHQPPQGMDGARPPGGGGPREQFEPFKLMGTLSVIFGAVSFFWLRFKKKLTSKSPLVKRLAKGFYKVHQVSGWAALLLVAAHGVFYLITKLNDDKIFSGLAAFAILLAIGGYGWFIRRYRTHPWMRKVHMTLSLVWIPALILHAGGSAIITVLVTAVLWGAVGLVEKASRPRSAVHEA